MSEGEPADKDFRSAEEPLNDDNEGDLLNGLRQGIEVEHDGD